MFKDFDLDRAIFVGMFATIGGIIAADQIKPLQKMLPAQIADPVIIGPAVGVIAVATDLGVRMAMAKGRGEPEVVVSTEA